MDVNTAVFSHESIKDLCVCFISVSGIKIMNSVFTPFTPAYLCVTV